MSLGLAIIRTAGLLVPATDRPAWFAEWWAELCYLEQNRDSRAFVFSLGAFHDALWFRRQSRFRWLESPAQCLSLIAIIAIISLTAARPVSSWSPFRDAAGVVVGQTDRPPAGAAFYRATNEAVYTRRGPALFRIVHGSANLFEVLHIPAPRPGNAPIMILSRSVWWDYFASDPKIVGRIFELGGKPVQIAAVIPDDAWPLPGYADVWLLNDGLPSNGSYVVARSHDQSHLHPPARRLRNSSGIFLMAILFAILTAPSTTLVRGIHRWPFLLTKIGLILLAAWAFACLSAAAERLPMVFLCSLAVCPGTVLALYWALTDQHRRCPVCLRFLSNPVRFGNPSQTFLDWYGTELMCAQGHGVLRVPAVAASCLGSHQWVGIDELCFK